MGRDTLATKGHTWSPDIFRKELNFFIFRNIEEFYIYCTMPEWRQCGNPDTSQDSLVLLKRMYGKFGMASAICSGRETSDAGHAEAP